jgi:hypothetical protein
MDDIWALGARAGALLSAREQKCAVAETSAGGLISASLLAVPGASKYFAGGAVTYSKRSIRALAGISIEDMRAQNIQFLRRPLRPHLPRRRGANKSRPHPAHRRRKPPKKHVRLRRRGVGTLHRGPGTKIALIPRRVMV